jgi:LysR family hydrogen peroxide-inducible transcriptional activator
MGGPLFERSRGQLQLTSLGAEFAERAAGILSSLRDLEDLAFTRTEILAGRLALGIIPSVAPYLLPRLLPVLKQRYPALRLTLREAVTASIVAELKEGTLDAVVVSLPLDDPALDEAAALNDRFLLAVPSGSELAGRNRVAAGSIDADDLLLLADGHCLRDQALSVCHMIDPRRLKSFGATSLTTILSLVAAGQGVTLLPELAADAATRSDRRLHLVPFEEPEPGRVLGVAWRKGSPRERDYQALRDAIASIE